MINIEEKERITNFIKNPIKTGIWETIFEWNNKNEIESKISHFNINMQRPQIQITPLIVLEIFNFLVKEKISTLPNTSPIVIEPKPVSLQNIDNNLLKSLNSSFENFEENYDCIDFFYSSLNNGLIINGSYIYILQSPYYENNSFVILSTNKEISNFIKKIFESCECISSTKQKFIRSPQSKLISPLFDFTNFIYTNLFTDWENNHYFREAYNLYYQQKYDNSISYLGKMTESLLTNIYESLFQEYVPDGFAIGQIQNSIQSKVKDIYRDDSNRVDPANFERIRDFCRENMDTIPLIHQITTLLKQEQKYRNFLLRENQSNNIEYSIFPRHIFTNLKKLLNYRNSVSHNSGTFFTNYDCLKMLFYFLSVYNWWQEVYDNIDWSKDKIKIIKKIVESRE